MCFKVCANVADKLEVYVVLSRTTPMSCDLSVIYATTKIESTSVREYPDILYSIQRVISHVHDTISASFVVRRRTQSHTHAYNINAPDGDTHVSLEFTWPCFFCMITQILSVVHVFTNPGFTDVILSVHVHSIGTDLLCRMQCRTYTYEVHVYMCMLLTYLLE